MEFSCSVGVRAALGSAAFAIGSLFASSTPVFSQAVTPTPTPVFSQSVTPTPTPVFGQAVTPTPTPLFRQPVAPTPTPLFSQPGTQTPTPTVAPIGGNARPTPASQGTSDQIAAIASQVGQVASDPTMTVEAKSQQITTLAAQFNQLVAIWQQQTSATSSVAAPVPGGVDQLTPGTGPLPPSAQFTPVPAGTSLSPTPTPTPTSTSVSAPTGSTLTADQLRAQIAKVANQMAQVSQDTSLSADLKTAQLNSLAAEFNQLMAQLQQLGG